jgi:hypothetical protein
VTEVAGLYKDVPFRNFEHASHVTLEADRLMSRMVSMDGSDEDEMHNATYGISADPLTHFAVFFGALIHDLGHKGIANSQLVLEEDKLAVKFMGRSVADQNSVNEGLQLLMDERYERLRAHIYLTNVERKLAVKFNGRSVAEQNSVNDGLQLLMDERYERLQAHIYLTNVERKRFRQVLTNAVMATDIADRDVKKFRSRKRD